ncbi:hypothetical protein JHW45_07195 [Paracoccus stylophorae]|uniref:Uncharacterized protein n=1 Tax=Paracoccus stylophorae TaxID=659350 RepID=A0ABY7SYW1_9RHOB|nr:hypothetical protein JHW45_07195 [Paracoccus stylophorae]
MVKAQGFGWALVRSVEDALDAHCRMSNQDHVGHPIGGHPIGRELRSDLVWNMRERVRR